MHRCCLAQRSLLRLAAPLPHSSARQPAAAAAARRPAAHPHLWPQARRITTGLCTSRASGDGAMMVPPPPPIIDVKPQMLSVAPM